MQPKIIESKLFLCLLSEKNRIPQLAMSENKIYPSVQENLRALIIKKEYF